MAAAPTAIELTGVTSEPGLNGVYEVNGTFPHNESSRTQYMKKGSRCKCRCSRELMKSYECLLRVHMSMRRPPASLAFAPLACSPPPSAPHTPPQGYIRYQTKRGAGAHRWEIYVSHHPDGTCYFSNDSDASIPPAGSAGWLPTPYSMPDEVPALRLIGGGVAAEAAEAVEAVEAGDGAEAVGETKQAEEGVGADGEKTKQAEEGASAFAKAAATGTSGASYRFPLEDRKAWLGHLREEGFVVLSRVADAEQVAEATALLWSDIEAEAAAAAAAASATAAVARPSVAGAAAGAAPGAVAGAAVVRCDDPGSWDAWNLPISGLCPNLAHSAGSWHVRGVPGVRDAFAHIWGNGGEEKVDVGGGGGGGEDAGDGSNGECVDLIVSMDCVLAWKPWWMNSAWTPYTEGLHLDQNPFTKPGLECVQGMMPLLPVTEVIGGLEVVPRSHTAEAKAVFKEAYPWMATRGDWCPLDEGDRIKYDAVLLLCDAGDLILWDSRTSTIPILCIVYCTVYRVLWLRCDVQLQV